MEAHEIEYGNPTGLAKRCIESGRFDIEQFKQLWIKQRDIMLLADIAKRHLNIDNLAQHKDLRAALLEAISVGQARSK